MKIIKYILFTLTVIISLNANYFIVSAQGKDGRLKGVVNWFNPAKGFGYITRDDGKGDLYVNFAGIEDPDSKGFGFRTLSADQKVSFKVVKSPRGFQADEVRKEK